MHDNLVSHTLHSLVSCLFVNLVFRHNKIRMIKFLGKMIIILIKSLVKNKRTTGKICSVHHKTNPG